MHVYKGTTNLSYKKEQNFCKQTYHYNSVTNKPRQKQTKISGFQPMLANDRHQTRDIGGRRRPIFAPQTFRMRSVVFS